MENEKYPDFSLEQSLAHFIHLYLCGDPLFVFAMTAIDTSSGLSGNPSSVEKALKFLRLLVHEK